MFGILFIGTRDISPQDLKRKCVRIRSLNRGAPMLKDDVQLIRRTLLGDDSAFAILVEKYQESVHALIWRKIGDFHHAEEITQDTFLQAYKKLETLKDPKCFAGWLYVIASRLALNWIQRVKPKTETQSLEETSIVEIEDLSYEHYLSEQRETKVAEQHSDIVKRLLEKLPESERTVVTLHYLGEMTTKEIGNFLGVSVNTIKSRLRRGRERLQAAESLVREVLGSVQLPANFTERILQQVAEINPIVPPTGKPMVPWMALGAAAVLVLLMLGAGNQYLARFQRPYSFEARSEPTVEIVDAPIVIDILSKPTLRKQFGRSPAPGKSIGAGTQISETTLRSNAQEDRRKSSTAQWTPSNSPPAGHVRDIFATPEGTVYAASSTGVYRLPADATVWTRANLSVPTSQSLMPMVENRGVLYIVAAEAIFASTDKGQTWKVFCPRPKGDPIGLIINEAQGLTAQSDITLYLALRDEGVFRSRDAGTRWELLNNGLTGERISAVAVVGKKVFAGTNRGLYRLDSGNWRKLPVGTSQAVYSLTVLEDSLYVATGLDLFGVTLTEGRSIMRSDNPSLGKIFRSRDLGTSWTEITPKDDSRSLTLLPSGIKVLAIGGTLFALGATEFRSIDDGETWANLGLDSKSFMLSNFRSVAINEQTFYKVGVFGVQRTTDSGESWHLFMDGMSGTKIKDLVAFNNRLYAHTGYEVFQSTNGSRSWQSIPIDKSLILDSEEQNLPRIDPSFDSKLVITANALYFLSPTKSSLRISRLSTDSTLLIPVQNVPDFENEVLFSNTSVGHQETETIVLPITDRFLKTGTAVVNNDVFYIEYKRALFKWRLGARKWTNTGLVDTSEQSDENLHKGFKLAVSGETIYVGKREGELFQSRDEGNTWKNLTPSLPIRFTCFKEITFSGSTLYIATDKGVLVSETGEYWRVITDRTDTRIVINQFVLDGHEVYGIADTAVYRLDTRGQWERFSTGVPDEVVSLAIANGRLYSAVNGRGIFNISLENAAFRKHPTQSLGRMTSERANAEQ